MSLNKNISNGSESLAPTFLERVARQNFLGDNLVVLALEESKSFLKCKVEPAQSSPHD